MHKLYEQETKNRELEESERISHLSTPMNHMDLDSSIKLLSSLSADTSR